MKSVIQTKLLILLLLINTLAYSQSTDKRLLSADKLFIKMAYAEAVEKYEAFLKKNPKDFYASRQAALCYTKINEHSKAIDHWPNVADNSQASEKDKLAYAKCLLANYRIDEAKKVFISLKSSSDKNIAAWGKAFENVEQFYEDSALTKVTELSGINTPKPEYSPYMYSNKLIYVNEPKKNSIIKILSSWTNEKFYTISAADRLDSLSLKNSTTFNKHIQSKKMNGPVCFTPNDSVIYFSKSAPKKELKKVKGLTYRMQLFYTRMNQFGDAHPEIMPFAYNSIDYDCMHPTISKDGAHLYFASNMSGGQGGFDIWVCTWDKGAWSKPVNCGPEVNTIGNEVFPFITKESILYFASDYKPGLGGLDVFTADPINKNEKFREAENLGASINTQFDDFGVFVKNGEKTGYLSSNRKNNFRDDDLFYFVNNKPKWFDSKIKIIDSVTQLPITANYTISLPKPDAFDKVDSGKFISIRLKPGKDLQINLSAPNYKDRFITRKITKEDTVIALSLPSKSEKSIKGKVIDKETNLPLAGVKVAIYDEFGNNYLNTITDSTGDYKAVNLPLDKPLFIGSEKRPDYFSNTEKFRIKQDSDLVKNIYTQKIVIGKAIKVDNIYFDLGKFNVRADAALELDKLVQLMKDNPDIIIELSSHTDCRGSASANLSLSDKRAKSSAAYIVSKGIAKNRIKGKGYGEGKLLNACACEGKKPSTCSEDEHAQNRRSEFKVTGFLQAKTDSKSNQTKKGK